ncbi:MAG: hypothetical protein B0D91_08775 [Oceanospirillales bacterium LUC14_002_19_P2]|nr:MAG: hypothetical protein B0D91_08775 [Oceanospirillales bacterium LUC14_002_19_P2]
MGSYIPNPNALVLSVQGGYGAPAAANVVLDVPSADAAQTFVSGTVSLNGEPADKEIVVVSYRVQQRQGQLPERTIIASGQSGTDGSFEIDLNGFGEPVLVLAIDEYGDTWQPNTRYITSDVVHPTTGRFAGFVYECLEEGISGSSEPEWWVDNGSTNTGLVGTAVFKARPFYQTIVHGPLLPAVRNSSGDG